MNFPAEYKNEIKKILNDQEYKKFFLCYNTPYYKGLRINTLKIDEEKFKEIFHFNIKKTNFSKNSYYIKEKINSIGNLPLHQAGAFYLQEPSASSVVSILDPLPGEKILDLCAAPGGKSTQIAAELDSKGLLWANEVDKNRAQILLSNIERMGVKNAVVSSCESEILCEKLRGFFDKVLVDAPCSLEGMFRKNQVAVAQWSLEYVKICAIRQLSILNNAAKALKKDGIIIYSTCTFSLTENEEVVYNFLKENNDFVLENIECNFGRPANQIHSEKDFVDTSKARRIFPMDGGEGHFIAKLRRKSENNKKIKSFNYKKNKNTNNKIYKNLFFNILNCEIYGSIEEFSGNVVILPQNLPNLFGLNVLRAGVLLGKAKRGNLLEPAHAVFMASKKDELKAKIDFSSDSKEILAYLKGEEILINEEISGYVGVCVDGVVTGYAKAVNGRLKNKYPKGLRIFN